MSAVHQLTGNAVGFVYVSRATVENNKSTGLDVHDYIPYLIRHSAWRRTRATTLHFLRSNNARDARLHSHLAILQHEAAAANKA